MPDFGSWAADCAERALPVYETRADSDSRPRAALEGIRVFAGGGKRTAQLRTLALSAFAAAREAGDPAAAAAARAAGLAAASAYTHPLADVQQTKHILGPAAYAARALELEHAGERRATVGGAREPPRGSGSAGRNGRLHPHHDGGPWCRRYVLHVHRHHVAALGGQRGMAGEYQVHPAGFSLILQGIGQAFAIGWIQVNQNARIDDGKAERRFQLREPMSQLGNPGEELGAQALGGNAGLHSLDHPQIAGDEGYHRVMGRHEVGGALGAASQHQHLVTRLDPGQ